MRRLQIAGFALLVVTVARGPVDAQASGVAATVHNLSVTGPGQIKAETETEVCKFCHIPHNPVVAVPLWSHALSPVTRYDTATMRRGAIAESAPQPDGSSRLCLSCHDGTVALGDIARGRLPMTGAQRLDRGRRSHLGTDLSGSHPISFVVPDGDMGLSRDASDMGLKPVLVIAADGAVKLDADGKMQCTTCHDPHNDLYHQEGKVPRFWVRPTVDEVCLACHELR